MEKTHDFFRETSERVMKICKEIKESDGEPPPQAISKKRNDKPRGYWRESKQAVLAVIKNHPDDFWTAAKIIQYLQEHRSDLPKDLYDDSVSSRISGFLNGHWKNNLIARGDKGYYALT